MRILKKRLKCPVFRSIYQQISARASRSHYLFNEIHNHVREVRNKAQKCFKFTLFSTFQLILISVFVSDIYIVLNITINWPHGRPAATIIVAAENGLPAVFIFIYVLLYM